MAVSWKRACLLQSFLSSQNFAINQVHKMSRLDQNAIIDHVVVLEVGLNVGEICGQLV